MWVNSPLEDTISLPWGQKKYSIKKGINEIPEMVAQAYFLYGLPDEVASDKSHFDGLQKHALLRWQMVLQDKEGPPKGEFLFQFLLADTREGLEEILTKPEIEKSVVKK
jgi:hypothetical protein